MLHYDPNEYEEFYIVYKNGKFGIIDTLTQEVVIDYVFNEIKWLYYYDEFERNHKRCVACLRLGSRWGIVPYGKLHKFKKP